MARFLHLADVHLGSHQYQNAERNLDFFRSFWAVVDKHAVPGVVDFVVLAGDLFDKRSIDAPTLGQATAVLKRLEKLGIPVFCVEGNHDRAYYGEGSSWLEYLNGLGLLRLLRNEIADDGTIVLQPWQTGQKPGGYQDFGDIRIIGSRYYGASTAKAIAPMAEAIKALPPAPFTLLVWHMGLEGYISSLAGGVSVTQLEPLRQCTDYLALGHVHTRYDVEDWLYNPGPLEPTNITEAALPHGALMVDVTSSGHVVTPLEDYPRRAFCRLTFELTPYDSPAEMQAAFPGFLARHLGQAFALAPIVEVSLTGTCRFSRSALDVDWIRQMVVATCAPLVVLLRNTSSNSSLAIAPDAHGSMDRHELERLILQDCFAQDARYRPTADQCGHLLLDLKNRLENGEKPLSLLNYLKEAVPMALKPAEQIVVSGDATALAPSDIVPAAEMGVDPGAVVEVPVLTVSPAPDVAPPQPATPLGRVDGSVANVQPSVVPAPNDRGPVMVDDADDEIPSWSTLPIVVAVAAVAPESIDATMIGTSQPAETDPSATKDAPSPAPAPDEVFAGQLSLFG